MNSLVRFVTYNFILTLMKAIWQYSTLTSPFKQFIRPNWSNYYCFELMGSNTRDWKWFDTMENQWLSCFNNRILLVGVGYTRRGNTTKTVVQPDRFVRRASQARMLITEQSSHWNKWLIWNTWTMLCKPLAKWTLCNYIWLTALTPRGCKSSIKWFLKVPKMHLV